MAANNGVQIVGIADGADSFAEGATLSTEIKAVIAAEFRRDVTRRTKAGLRRRAAAGKISTHAPFGYLLGTDGHLVIDEVKADVIARNFAAFARGERTTDIVARLNESAAPSPRGNGWRHDTFIYTLKNSVYMGEFRSFRTPRRRAGGGARIPRDPNEAVIISCPAIVSRELFESVQARITFNRKWCATSPKRTYILRSLLRCGVCGHAYVGHAITGRKYKGTRYADFRYYECGTLSNQDYDFCRNVRLNADKIERLIWDEIERFMRAPSKIIERLTARYGRQTSTEQAESRKGRKIDELKRKNLEARERLALAVARGVLPDEDATLAADALAKEAISLRSQEAELTRARSEAQASKKQMLDAGTVLKALRDQLGRGLEPAKKSEIVRCLLREAVVTKGRDGRVRVAVQYVFPSPLSFSPVGLAFSASSRKK